MPGLSAVHKCAGEQLVSNRCGAPVSSVVGHAVTLTTVSATSISGFVKRSRTLPASIAVLADLQSYEPWESPGV